MSMSFASVKKKLVPVPVKRLLSRPRLLGRAMTKDHRLLHQMDWLWTGFLRGQQFTFPEVAAEAPDATRNPLRSYFDAYHEGPGIWKWIHYFDVYHRHFEKYRGKEVHILEIGIYSGGSLKMWRDYFGPRCHIYGVDIEGACKKYEGDQVKVFIGDQSDRSFWEDFKKQVPKLDIVVDDGGHFPHQQVPTLEALLPHLRPGGVFLCEDVQSSFNELASYANGLVHDLNSDALLTTDPGDSERRTVVKTTPFQAAIHSIHFYPFVVAIEKRDAAVDELVGPKHGTQWEPHLT
jgi:hypothetical protein